MVNLRVSAIAGLEAYCCPLHSLFPSHSLAKVFCEISFKKAPLEPLSVDEEPILS